MSVCQYKMASLLSRYKGSLVGGVVGDCIGQVFECLWSGPMAMDTVLKESVDKIESKSEKKPKIQWQYTDDTAMARSVVKSLIERNKLDSKDMARRFMTEYHAESDRGYGGGVVTVFRELKENNCEDIFGPAARQFNGQGSYGNGAAMRIAPAALFAHQKQMSFDQLKDMVTDISRLTHTHQGAVDGAILQCYAVYLALTCITGTLDINQYVDELKSKMKLLEATNKSPNPDTSKGNEVKDASEKNVETRDSDSVPEESETMNANSGDSEETMTYCKKLEALRKFALQEEEPLPETVVDELGTDIAASDSVPAAIYSFLRATKPINGLENRNPLERTVLYAISLGGDTDTIATMAGSIAGAYYGIEDIPSSWCKFCEGVTDSLNDAEKLHKL